MIFDIANSSRKSNFSTLQWDSKASQDAYNWRRLLILWDRLNDWVAKGVAPEVNDFNAYLHI